MLAGTPVTSLTKILTKADRNKQKIPKMNNRDRHDMPAHDMPAELA